MGEIVLVTGGTGYVAAWCIVELLRRGYRVRATIRDRSKEPAARAAVESAGVPSDRLSFVVADLKNDNGWDVAMAGCAFVLHVASPLGDGTTHAADALIAPARDGTLRVLRAATQAGVKRVVMTSAAATARPPQDSDVVSDETIWADADDPQFDAYRRSKILAERAAWDFVERQSVAVELVTILPGAVFGPVLTKRDQGSVRVIDGLLRGRPPAIPRLGFWVVDVRDLADLHVRAMTSPSAAGQRFIAAGDFMWMRDIASVLRTGLGGRAAKVPTRTLPDAVVKLLARFIAPLKWTVPFLGRTNPLTSAKARRVLGFVPRPGATTVVDCAESLLAMT
jgi:dihydroflavonol-4-reductase